MIYCGPMDYLAIQDQLKALEEDLKTIEQEAQAAIRGAVDAINAEELAEVRRTIAACA